MGWHMRTFRQITKVTEIALIDDFGVIRDIDSVHFHGVAVVNKVEECWKRVTQAHTPLVCAEDVLNPLELFIEVVLIPKFWIVLVEWVSCRRT